ncbi:MAG TPA: diguanylate cyclase [Sulfurimonas autotrophica]|nr:diguanylate cyclase [Sulfurimonas autotrophica]
MIFFQKYRFFIGSVVFFTIVGATLFVYSQFIKIHEQKIQQQEYQKVAQQLQDKIQDAILLKKKATLAIALALAYQADLQNRIRNNTLTKHCFNAVVQQFRENTLYKNIWIQVTNQDGRPLCRSWTKKLDNNLHVIRDDIAIIQKTKKPLNSVSVDKFDLSIKSMVPILDKEKLIAVFEVISHFNSIAQEFKKDGLESVVVATKEQSKHIKYPFSKLFIDSHYVANLDANEDLLKLLQRYGVENMVKKPYIVIEDYLIAISPLKDTKKRVVGYYFIFQKLDTLSNRALERFFFEWVVLGLLFFSFLGAFITITLYFVVRKQKKYYKNIIDSSKNIIVVSDKKRILEVNKIFFKYFSRYKTLEEFHKKNSCLCDFFVKEEGYLDRGDVMYHWLDVVLQNPDATHKAKMDIEGKVYYFLVNVAIIDKEKEHYSVVLADITQEEIFKKELELSAITDPLTGVYNRRYYHERIQKEMYEAKRYGFALSLIMCDIDFFKKVNDLHGHDVGDEVLKYYTKLLQDSLRTSDAFCRIGGEEFMIILAHTNKEQAIVIAEKLRKKVQESKKILPITMSFGVTEYISGESEDELFKRVDKALYKAKESGRNRVVSE